MKKNILSIITVTAMAALMLLTSCSGDDIMDMTADEPTRSVHRAERTVIAYMSGENNLNYGIMKYLDMDLEEMLEGSRMIGDQNLLVYVDRSDKDELPYLARLKDGVKVDSLSISDMGISSKDEYASDPRVFESVLRFAFNRYPSTGGYGLILWGHSTGWTVEKEIATTRAYGFDNGHNDDSWSGYWLNIPTMADILSRLPHLDFIFADCCYFMCAEDIYELRNVTDYIIGSTSEIPGFGAPYNTVVPALFQKKDFAIAAMERYHEAYPDMLPLSVAKTSEAEQFAEATRSLLTLVMNSMETDYADMTGLIHYGYDGSVNGKFDPAYNMFYDMGDFFRTYATDAEYAAWKQSLDRLILKRYSAKRWDTMYLWYRHFTDFTMTEEKCHGISMFVPQNPNGGNYGRYNREIRQMQWYKAVWR